MRVRDRTTKVITQGPTPMLYGETRGSGNVSWGPLQGSSWSGPCYTPKASEHCEDVVTPNFKKRLAAGEIINNPFYIKKIEEWTPQPVPFTHTTLKSGTYGDYGYKWYGNYVPFSQAGLTLPNLLGRDTLPGVDDLRASVISKAVTAAHANVDESEILALATLAEGRKTVDFMVTLMRRVFRLARNIRKLNMKALANELSPKEVAQKYMEVRYAVRPLMYDVVGILQALEKERGVVRQTYRGYASDRIDHEVVNDRAYFYETTVGVKSKRVYTVSARAGVLTNVTIEKLTPFGLDHLLETGWEILPFSFIVDWFANVGDVIAAHTPNAGVTQLASWVTVKETFTSTNSLGSIRSTAPNPPWSGTNTSTSGDFAHGYKELVLERIVEPALSLWPESKLRLDGFKILDLGIILRQVLR